MRRLAYLLIGLFLAKATAVVLFVLPYATLAGETGVLAWLREAYDLRVGVLIITGAALYGTVAWVAFVPSVRQKREAPGSKLASDLGHERAHRKTDFDALRAAAWRPGTPRSSCGRAFGRLGAWALAGLVALNAPAAKADAALVDGIFGYLDACIEAVDAELKNGV
ncbi:MAG: hypothetical protein AAGB15_09340, partial [Pseudomonadota bacterium]